MENDIKKFIEVMLNLNVNEINNLVDDLVGLKGRLFILGVGGSAANASHAVNDFRKICNIETYAPTDNVSELTARTNDNGWDSVFVDWLKVSKLKKDDMILIFSVGGGTEKASKNLSLAIDFAKEVGCTISGIVGPNGGKTYTMSRSCVRVPVDEGSQYKTPFTESLQAVIWHLVAMNVRDKQNDNNL
jgi:D-sedoheptulose 7-phosphate isomerase